MLAEAEKFVMRFNRFIGFSRKSNFGHVAPVAGFKTRAQTLTTFLILLLWWNLAVRLFPPSSFGESQVESEVLDSSCRVNDKNKLKQIFGPGAIPHRINFIVQCPVLYGPARVQRFLNSSWPSHTSARIECSRSSFGLNKKLEAFKLLPLEKRWIIYRTICLNKNLSRFLSAQMIQFKSGIFEPVFRPRKA